MKQYIRIRNERMNIQVAFDLIDLHGRDWYEQSLFDILKDKHPGITMDEIKEGLKILDEVSTDN